MFISLLPRIFNITVLSIYLICFKLAIAKKDCIRFDASITQKIEHLGFHRDINWLIETQNLDRNAWFSSSCNAAVMLEISQEMFVNPDQADDLKRLGKLDIFIDGLVDIEAPAHEANKHTIYVYLNNSQMNEKVSIKLPIHLRYQRSLMGGHGKVPLNKPSLLIYCPYSTQICGRDHKVNAPVSSKNFKTLRDWINVTYKALDIFIDGLVDIEAPAHEANKHTIYVYLNNSQMNEKVSIKLPIHLRYQRSLMGGHGKVPLNKPSLLIYCPYSTQICGRDHKVNAPVSSKNFKTLRDWINVTYKANFDEMELLVPIGDLEHYPYVATISCILGCVGCIYILSLLSNSE